MTTKVLTFSLVFLLSQTVFAKRYFAPQNPSDGQVEFYFQTTSGVFTLDHGKTAGQSIAPTLLKNNPCAKAYAAIVDAALPKLKASLGPKLAKIRASKKTERISVTFALSTHYDFPKNNINYDRCGLNVTLAQKSNDDWADFTPIIFSNSKGTITVDKGYYKGAFAQTSEYLAQATVNYLTPIVLKTGSAGVRNASAVTPLESK